jgi:hypothetical protein
MQGIYKITNTKTGMFYIGSSKDLEKRKYKHFHNLKNNNHVNKKLQSSYNKYGEECFIFEVIRNFPDWYTVENRYRAEQVYLDSLDKNKVYNLCFTADGGGSDVLAKPVYLLSLKGIIINEFESIQDCRRYIGGSQINTRSINSEAIVRGKYRITTIDFYENNFKDIMEWKKETYLEKQTRLDNERRNKRIITITVDNVKHEFSNMAKAGEFIGVSRERVRQILKYGSKWYDLKLKYE